MKKRALLLSIAAMTMATSMTALADDPTELTVWVSNELHKGIFEFGENAYNEAHPDAPVDVNVEVFPASGRQSSRSLLRKTSAVLQTMHLYSKRGLPALRMLRGNTCSRHTQALPSYSPKMVKERS